MTLPSIDIDQVVREVLAQLGQALQGDSAPASVTSEKTPAEKAPAEEKPAAAAAGSDEQSLVISSRVVTISELDGGLDHVRRVVVPPGAVVTPSVRDVLAKRRIPLVREEAQPSPSASEVRVVVTTLGKSFDSAGLITALRKEKLDVDPRHGDCLIAASDEFARELADGRALGVMLTSQPAIGLCLANRLSGVRAVLGIDAVQTPAAAASVGANLLVVAPRGKTFFQLKHLIREFCRDGARPCPDLLKERLS